jgi:hypothetical protein
MQTIKKKSKVEVKSRDYVRKNFLVISGMEHDGCLTRKAGGNYASF